MREGWSETTLEGIAEVIMGQSPDGKSYNQEGNGLPFLQGSAEFGEHYPVPEKWCSDPKKIADPGDLLLSVRAPVGDTNFADQRIAVGRGLSIIRANKKSLTEFIRLVIQLNVAELIATSGSGMFASITGKNLREFKVNLPPLPEQKRIVDIISSIDSYIEALQHQLESAKKSRNALVESQILELAGSSLFSLKNLSTKIGSGATPRGGEEVYIKTGVNLIRSQNVHDSNFVMRGLVAIEDSAAKALESVTVEDGDVLINITGASVTRCCVVDSTILPARVNQHVAIIRSERSKILPKYLVLVLTSNKVKGFLNDIAGTGSTRQALTKTHLEELEIPVPNISIQAEIIQNSDAFDLTISKSQITLDEAKKLRSSLLIDLLSGEHEIPGSYDKVIGAA